LIFDSGALDPSYGFRCRQTAVSIDNITLLPRHFCYKKDDFCDHNDYFDRYNPDFALTIASFISNIAKVMTTIPIFIIKIRIFAATWAIGHRNSHFCRNFAYCYRKNPDFHHKNPDG
jgi:hypothetical protein